MAKFATMCVWLVLCAVLALSVEARNQRQVDSDGCHMECPKSMSKNGGGEGGEQNCRWILRTDGKSARLCKPAKCKKVCPQQQEDDMARGGSSSSERIEQQTEPTGSMLSSASSQQQSASSGGSQPVGIMQAKYGNKLKQAPVPGVPGGRLSPTGNSGSSASGPGSTGSSGVRQMAPTLAPEVSYDDNDTPPPISRFLDISPEE